MAPQRDSVVVESSHRYGVFGTRRLTVAGRGVPIVLLHGFADTADTWRGVLAGLADRGHVGLAVDVRGFGAADPFSPGPLLPQLDTFVDAVLEDVGPAVLVGNSLGVAMAVRAAQRCPAAVVGLVALNEPVLSEDWRARLARGVFGRAAPWLMRRIPLPARLVRPAVAGAVRLLYADPRSADPAVTSAWSGRYGNRDGAAWVVGHAVRFGLETRDGYGPRPVTCPVLIMHGRKDRIIAPRAGLALHRAIPGSEFVLLPRAGHCPQLDDPAGIACAITDFIDARVGRDGEAAG
ncbi:alpha/beta fold hydrolase [Nocardia terpenica]|uniref:Alpha/beta fold hydrolase n=1 Tax=Nocardia terpenica TaxID=455432 RepID=A0A6G9YVD4_9NOCA|nr:alpha/beta hydrolase [Nocardia terpenica]QIS16966.1 alpha/beta fold hydrolase [Nocardia terpenica]